MICLHCGYCCIQYSVIIINPLVITPTLDLSELPENGFLFKDSGVECPHLSWKGDLSCCKLHIYDWYKDTPCYQFGQIEDSPNVFCRIGLGILRNQLKNKRKQKCLALYPNQLIYP